MKKIISLLLSLTFFIGCLTVHAQDTTINDVDERIYNILNSLGVAVPITSDIPEEGWITRAQFASSIVNLMGYTNTTLTNENEFSDVSMSHDFAKDIYSVSALGIMGVGGGSFRPDEPIGYYEAICAAVRVLGYDDVALDKGGYPNGYFLVAESLGILKGFASDYGKINRPNTIRLLYNMLHTPVLQLSGIKGDDSVYESDRDKDLLRVYLNGDTVDGIVVATEYSAVGSNSKAVKDCVTIDGINYYVGNSDAQTYLGQSVTAYAKLLNDDDRYMTIVYIEREENSDVVVVNMKDVISVDGFDSTDNISFKKSPVIRYADENNRSKKINVKPSVQISYNGVVTDNVSNSDFTNGSGEVLFCKTGNSGDYDFIAINNYKSYQVTRLDLDYQELFLKDQQGRGISVDLTSIMNNAKIYKYSQIVDLSVISTDDIVSIAASKTTSGNIDDAELIYINICSNVVKQKAQQLDESKNMVMLSDKWYDVATSIFSDINISKEQNFYLDVFGTVCAISDVPVDGTEYGYFLEYRKASGLELKIAARILRMDGKIESYYLSDKVKYTGNDATGNWIDGASVMLKKMDTIFAQQFTNKQLVKFALDSEGKISTLLQPIDMEDKPGYGGFSNENFTIDDRALVDECYIQNNMLTQNYRMDTQTKVIIVPNTGAIDDIVIGTGDSMPGVASVLNSVEIYDATDVLNAGVVVAHVNESVGGSTPSNSFVEQYVFVVEKVITSLREDGDVTYKLCGMTKGKKTELYAKDSQVKNKWISNWDGYNTKTLLSELTFGDVVIIETSPTGDVSGVLILFSFDGENLPDEPMYVEHAPSQSWATLLNTSYGEVVKNTDGKTLRLSSSSTRIFPKAGNIYFCDMNKKTVELGNMLDIRDADFSNPDWVFVKCRKNEVWDFVVYRK